MRTIVATAGLPIPIAPLCGAPASRASRLQRIETTRVPIERHDPLARRWSDNHLTWKVAAQ